MIKLVGIAVISAVLYILVGKNSKEYSTIIEIVSVILIVWIAFPYVCDIIDFFSQYSDIVGINSEHIKTVLKALGIAVITQFAAEICRDAGESAMSSKIEFAGKSIILALSIPMTKSLFEMALNIIKRR